jgi:hypothetical protein
MKRLSLATLAAFAVAYLVFGAAPSHGRTPGTVELLWMSAVDYQGEFCVTQGYHGSNGTAVDLVADDDGSICSSSTEDDGIQWVYIRTWGFADTTHKVTSAYVLDGEYPDQCDFVEARNVGVDGKLRGTEQYLHARDLWNPYWYDIWAAPEPYGRTQTQHIGWTIAEDDGCPWTGHHVHQAASSACNHNGGLRAVRVYETWNVFNHVHKYIWTEGQNC